MTAIFSSFKKRLACGVVTINFLVLSLAGYSVYLGKNQQENLAKITTENITNILSQSINGVLDAINLALLAEKAEAERHLATGSIDRSSFDAHLANMLTRIPELNNLRMADANGDILYGLEKDEKIVNVADREYFTTLRDHPNLEMTLSKPLFGRVSNKWIIIAARRVNFSDGSFAGVIHGNIPLEYFKNIFSILQIGNRGIITLRGEDLTIVYRYPETATSTPGNLSVSQEFRDMIQKGQESATYRIVSKVDGITRQLSYRKIADYPFYINCGLAPQDYLISWYQETGKILAMYFLFLISSVLTSRLLTISWEARQQALDHLNTLNNTLESRVLERTEELRCERQRLTNILYGSNDGIWDWDISTGKIIVNNRWAEILGYTLDELFPTTVKTWEEHVYPEDMVFAYEAIGKCLEGLTPSFAVEYRMLTKTGEIVWILDRGKVVERDETGKAVHAAGTHTDITGRKLAEQALQQSDEKVRLLLDSTAEAIMGVDLQGNCTFANASSIRMLGFSEQEQLFGRNMHSLLQHSHLQGQSLLDRKSQIIEAFRRGKKIHLEDVVLRRIDGTSFPVEYWSHPQVHNSVVTGAVVTFMDISERVKAQEQLVLQQEQLELLNLSLRKRVEDTVSELRQKDQILISQGRLAAMGEMIGNIAHQWRQPLNVLAILITNLQLTYQDNELTGKFMDESVGTAHRLIQKMSATINDFSKFFSPDKERVPFSAHKQIQLAVEMVEAAFKNNSITITVDSETDCNLEGFPNEYSQVLLNLLINAKDAIVESGSKQGDVHITIRKTDGMGTVTVRDNGCGIPIDLLDKIFDPYFSTKSMGTGIGLYMSKMIIERNMNGRIEVTTSEEGSEFLVTVPLAC